MKIVIIGAGLFGNIMAATLRGCMQEVTVIADQRDDMGSNPAACLMKPSWASKMGSSYDDSIELLSIHYQVHDIEFEVKPTGLKTICQWVDPAEVVRPPDILGTVIRIKPGVVEWTNYQDPRGFVIYDQLIVCTGMWDNLVDPLDGLQGKGGWAFLFPGQLPKPFIQPWAPYRQLVAFNRDPNHIWVGDGTALLPESMTKDRLQVSLERCAKAIGAPPETAEVLRGFRPYLKGLKEPALMKEVCPGNAWIVTGGAKNGTLGAAWAARKMAEKLRLM